jgi:hypothetical protein
VTKKWLILAVCAGLATLAVVALLVWCVAEDARQAALLDARVREADFRAMQAFDRVIVCRRWYSRAHTTSAEEVHQAELEYQRASTELDSLKVERARRQQSWHARLLHEVRRRTGW